MKRSVQSELPRLRLDRVVMREIRLPLVTPFRSAGGVVDARRVLIVELHDVDGRTAWAECVAEAMPSYSPETVDTAWLAIGEWLAPRLVNGGALQHRAVPCLLADGIRGHQMARAALEMGTWALAATTLEESLAALVAGASCPGAATAVRPRAAVETGIVIGMFDSVDALVARARAARDEGYRRIKIKVAPGDDVEPVGALRDALGPYPLSVDANCSYSLDDATHVNALDRLDAFGLTMIEQPLGAGDLVRHAALQQRLATPLCLDESITSVAAAEDMLTLGAGRMVNIKPGRVSGFAQAIAIHDRMIAGGIPVWCGGMLETGIGRAYNVALASLPGFTEPSDLSPSSRYWERDVVRPAWTMDSDGRVRVPLDRSGLGVDVDDGYLDDLTVRSRTIA